MKLRTVVALAATSLVLLTTGCAQAANTAPSKVITIKVAAVSTPMTDAIEAAGRAIGKGYKVQLVPVSDYVQPNVLLQHAEIDANLVQFVPFMDEFNEKNNATLVGVQPVYKTVVAFYSKTLSSLKKLPEGGSVVIPNDKANAARALQMLADKDIITLNPKVKRYGATLDDVTSNPRHLKFTEVGLLQLNTAYDEADAVFDLPSFARQLHLTPEKNGLAIEQDPQFAVTLVSRKDNAHSPEIAALIKAFKSDEVRKTLTNLNVPPAF